MLGTLVRRPAVWVPLVAFIAFLPSLLSGFVYDDVLLITENEYVQSLSYLGRAFTTHFWDVERYGSAGIGLVYYRPLVTASLLLNWLVSGGRAWPFHAVNLLLHVACVALAFRMTERWTKNRTIAVIAALVFALHPSRTESVIWIAGRTDVMAALFLLLAVEAAALAARASGRRRAGFSAATIACSVCAILCKESAVLLPMLLAVDALAEPRGTPARRTTWTLAGVVSMVGAVYLVIRSLRMPVRQGDPTEVTPLHALSTVAYYAERVVLPWPQTFFYRPLETQGGFFTYSWPHVLAGLLLVALVTYLCLRWARTKPVAAACVFTGVVFLGPLINFTYTGIYVSTSDHFLYLPLWLVTVGVAKGLEPVVDRLREVRMATIVVAGLCLAWGGVDAVRALELQNNDTLWARELEINPYNPVVLREVALQKAADGRLDEALELNLKSLEHKSTRYALLANPSSNVEVYSRALAMDAALTPDGDVERLRVLFGELDALAEGRATPRVSLTSSIQYERDMRPDVLERIVRRPYVRAKFAAEAALVASRIGRDDDARRLLAYVTDADYRAVANPANVVLTHARIGDFAGAERRLRYLGSPPPGQGNLVDPRTLSDLRARVNRAREKAEAAAASTGAERLLLQAGAYADTGAQLRALRALRPVYDIAGPNGLPAYVELLLAVGLKKEATAELAKILGPDAARQEVERFSKLQAQGAVQRHDVPEPSPWWPPAPGER